MRELDHNGHSAYFLYYYLIRSQSFCLLTAGGAPIETIREYIASQVEK